MAAGTCSVRVLKAQLSAPHDWWALEAKWMGVCRLNSQSLHRRIGTSDFLLLHQSKNLKQADILCIPFEQWGASLIYFTGNDIVSVPSQPFERIDVDWFQFNRSLRLYARKKGYSLNQRGLYRRVIRGKDGLKLTEGKIVGPNFVIMQLMDRQARL